MAKSLFTIVSFRIGYIVASFVMNKSKMNGIEHRVAPRPDEGSTATEQDATTLEDKRRQLRRARSHSRRILQRGYSVSSQAGRLDSVGSVFGSDNPEVT